MKEELTKILYENDNKTNFDAPYDVRQDQSAPKVGHKRKPVLTLRKLNQLKKIRNEKREELAQDSVFVPILYGPDMSNPEGGDMGMGGGMPM